MKKIFSFILLLLLCGCSSPTPHFYQPVALSNNTVDASKLRGTILLQSILLPSEINRPQITTIGENDYELKIDEFHRWGATPDKLFQRVIAQDLAYYLPDASIEVQTQIRKNYKYAVAIEVTEMSGKLGKTAYFSAAYFIKNSSGYTVKRGKIKEKLEIQSGYDEYVMAQSSMFDKLAKKIADDLSHL